MATVTSRENAQKSVFTGRHVRHTLWCHMTMKRWVGYWVANPVLSFVPRKFAQLLGTCVKRLYRVFSLMWPASVQIYWNDRKRLHKKRVQLPEDCFGTPTWRRDVM